MVKLCFKCKKAPNIKINILNYCNDCFIKMFEGKVFKNITGTTLTTKISVLLRNDNFSMLLHYLLINYFEKRPACNVKIICSNEINFSKCSKFEYQQNYKFISNNDLENIFNENFFLESDLTIVAEPIEILLSKSLGILCKGKGIESVENCIFSHPKFINIFKDVKLKEISYYIYLKNLNRIFNLTGLNKTEETLLDFLLEIDSKNSLAVFNVLNTFKKLKKE